MADVRSYHRASQQQQQPPKPLARSCRFLIRRLDQMDNAICRLTRIGRGLRLGK